MRQLIVATPGSVNFATHDDNVNAACKKIEEKEDRKNGYRIVFIHQPILAGDVWYTSLVYETYE